MSSGTDHHSWKIVSVLLICPLLYNYICTYVGTYIQEIRTYVWI